MKHNEIYENFDMLVELLGADKVLSEIKQWLTTDQVEELCNDIIDAYDVECFGRDGDD